MYIINPTRKHSYSRPLNIFLDTHNSEIKELVNIIFNKYFNAEENVILKKHLEVLVLDLYIAWNTDPKLEIVIHMSPNSYTLVKRYNQLNITKKMIDIVTVLINHDLIIGHEGFENNTKINYICASLTLENYFKKIKVSVFDISQYQELIILKDISKKDIDYEDNSKTKDIRKVLEQYNEILRKTFIDIPFLEKSYLEYKGRKYNVNQHSKLVKKIFSNGSFDDGGKFYGGWWQRISEKQREKILMDDRETIEIDYKSLHPVLAYAKKGIDFWERTNTTKYSYFNDSYDVSISGIKDREDSRAVVKLLFLTALNTNSEQECFHKFRNQWDYELHSYKGLFSDIFLQELLDSIRDRHYQIDDLFCSGNGLDLQKLDNEIIEYIVGDFTERNLPILCNNNSFIIWKEQLDLLVNNMHTAVKWVIGGIVENSQIQSNQFNILAFKDHILRNIDKSIPDQSYYSDSIMKSSISSDRCEGYIERWDNHKSYFYEKYDHSKQ